MKAFEISKGVSIIILCSWQLIGQNDMHPFFNGLSFAIDYRSVRYSMTYDMNVYIYIKIQIVNR